jgi:hypothetical protein
MPLCYLTFLTNLIDFPTRIVLSINLFLSSLLFPKLELRMIIETFIGLIVTKYIPDNLFGKGIMFDF